MTQPLDGPALPWSGVLATLASYSSKGQLYAALAAVTDPEHTWSATDVRRRARRILLAQALPAVALLPISASTWIDALPAQVRRHRFETGIPVGHVDWVRTRLQRWPPERFVTTHRSRHPDDLLVSSFVWTAQRLLDVSDDATAVVPGLTQPIKPQLAALQQALSLPPVAGAQPVAPGRPELAALRSTGRPWSALARTADILRNEEINLDALARELLLPDDDLRWRLFHLGCLGVLLLTLQARGWTALSRHPIGIGGGPSYTLTDPRGRQWDLWFEAAGIWQYYGAESPYIDATQGLSGVGQPLGADLALVRHRDTALAFECKYSADSGYIVRNGYHQAMTYLTELHTAIAPNCSAIVLGPDEILRTASSTTVSSGRLHLTPPSRLPEVLAQLVD